MFLQKLSLYSKAPVSEKPLHQIPLNLFRQLPTLLSLFLSTHPYPYIYAHTQHLLQTGAQITAKNR